MYQLTPSKKYKDFYEIPGFSRYVINRSGVIISKKSGEVLTGSKNPAGYIHYRIWSDKRKYYFTIGQHRLLLLTFKYVQNHAILEGNHRNGNKSDNTLDNLEWTTPRENCIHAGHSGLSPKCIAISTRNVLSGEIRKYDSILECANDLKLSKDAIRFRVSNGEHRVYPEGLQYRKSHSDEVWSSITCTSYQRNRKIIVTFINSEISTIFDSARRVANFYKISEVKLSNWLKHPEIIRTMPNGDTVLLTLLDDTL